MQGMRFFYLHCFNFVQSPMNVNNINDGKFSYSIWTVVLPVVLMHLSRFYNNLNNSLAFLSGENVGSPSRY